MWTLSPLSRERRQPGSDHVNAIACINSVDLARSNCCHVVAQKAAFAGHAVGAYIVIDCLLQFVQRVLVWGGSVPIRRGSSDSRYRWPGMTTLAEDPLLIFHHPRLLLPVSFFVLWLSPWIGSVGFKRLRAQIAETRKYSQCRECYVDAARAHHRIHVFDGFGAIRHA
jgi:hypothetical protein